MLLKGSKTSVLRRRGAVSVQARAEDLSVQDRVCGALPYLVPLLDGIRYGRFFIAQFPATAQILAPIRPLMNFYYGLPLASLVVFFGVYWVANNVQFSRHIRFNAMQALYLSLILVVPSLFEQVFRGALSGQIRISLYNTIWIFVVSCVTYGCGASLLGGSARLPIVADTADQRIP